jgi:molecular chaperone GrpE (heat shock protein)
MAGWLSRFLGRSDSGSADAERLLALERTVQDLRLQLEERTRQLATLQEERERQRTTDEARVADALRTTRERIFTAAAAPVTQLLTQAHLLEVKGKPVQPRDLLAVARRLVRVLEDEGLTIEGRMGDRVTFDPTRHTADGDMLPGKGQTVVVCFPGVSYQGRILQRPTVYLHPG